jgi:hypothetical protein
MTRTAVLIAGSMLACALNVGATCVIVVVERDQIILASDGLETHPGSTPQTVCKIAASPHAAVTMVGLIADANTGLDLRTMARTVLDAADGLKAQLAAFASAAAEMLQQELDVERSLTPGIYSQRLGKPLAEVIFAGFEQGRAVAHFQRYSTSANGQVEQHPPRQATTDRAPRMFVFCDAADEYMRNTPELRRLDSTKLVRILLRYEIEVQPKGARTVGPPVAILALRQSGPRWTEPGACGTGRASR